MLCRNCQIKNLQTHLVLLGLWLLTPLQYGYCCKGFLICYLNLGTLGLNSIMKSYLVENQCTSFHENNMVAITSMTWEKLILRKANNIVSGFWSSGLWKPFLSNDQTMDSLFTMVMLTWSRFKANPESKWSFGQMFYIFLIQLTAKGRRERYWTVTHMILQFSSSVELVMPRNCEENRPSIECYDPLDDL